MKPKLLFLSQCLPYPPNSGVTNRTYNILKGLARSFDIRLLAFRRHNHQATPEHVDSAREALGRIGVRVIRTFRIRSESSQAAKLAVHALSALTGRAYTYLEYSDRDFLTYLQRELTTQPPALIHVDSLDLHRWIPLLEGFPVACTHHSIESDLVRRRAQQEHLALFRSYLFRQAAAIEAVERAMCPQFAMNVMMSDADAARLRRLAPSAKTCVAPNGVDVDTMKPLSARPTVKGRVAFLGPSYMRPNFDGVEFFLREVWPLVRHARRDATFQIIGKVSRSHQSKFEKHPSVTCTGFVPDLPRVLAEASCFVVPLRIGGGTRLKILDAWAMARPVVSTTIGCEGLDAQDGVNILIRDGAPALADALVQVLDDDALAERISVGGRWTAEAHYSWGAISSALADEYLKLDS